MGEFYDGMEGKTLDFVLLRTVGTTAGLLTPWSRVLLEKLTSKLCR
jgi:hypothetical protein